MIVRLRPKELQVRSNAPVHDWFGASPACFLVSPKGYDFTIGERISAEALLAAGAARSHIMELLSR
ncbi:MAG: hypothetical protein Q7O66_23215 [Dehalococcoidia bacterium]|nr:hypothetical protein [Dehalococcoidia bacterium]